MIRALTIIALLAALATPARALDEPPKSFLEAAMFFLGGVEPPFVKIESDKQATSLVVLWEFKRGIRSPRLR